MLSNQELVRLERMNRQQPRPTNTTMGDHGGQDDLTAAMELMQQQMQKMQQTINTQEAARQAAAELAAQQAEQQGAPNRRAEPSAELPYHSLRHQCSSLHSTGL